MTTALPARCPTPVASLPPWASGPTLPLSVPKTLQFSMPIDHLPSLCGLLFFDGLINEGAQPEADVEVPPGAEELESLTGLGRDADRKRNTVQHPDT